LTTQEFSETLVETDEESEGEQRYGRSRNKEYEFVLGRGAIHVDAKFGLRELRTEITKTAILLSPFGPVGESVLSNQLLRSNLNQTWEQRNDHQE